MASESSIDVVHVVASLERRGDSTVAVAAAQYDDPSVSTTILAGPSLASGGGWWGSESLHHVDLVLVPNLVAGRSPLRDLMALRTLVQQLKQLEPDVVHTHGPKPGRLGRLAALIARVPRVHSVSFGEVERLGQNGTGLAGAVAGLRLRLERWLAIESQRLVVGGRFEQDRIASLGIGDPDRHRLIRSGVSLPDSSVLSDRRRRYRTELGLVGRVVVGSADCLGADSDPFTVIEGFWLSAVPGATLLLIGEGPHRSKVEARVRELVERDPSIDIRLLGYRNDSAELLAACDIAVEASRNAMSRSMLEAAAAGCCLVAPDQGSATDLVEDRRSGRLIDPGNPAALSRALEELADNAERRQRFGAEALQSCRPFAIDRMRGDLVNLWWEVASGRLQRSLPESEPAVSSAADAVTSVKAGRDRAWAKSRRRALRRDADEIVETTSS